MDGIKCESCGQIVKPDGSTVDECPECGTPISNPLPTPKPRRRKKKTDGAKPQKSANANAQTDQANDFDPLDVLMADEPAEKPDPPPKKQPAAAAAISTNAAERKATPARDTTDNSTASAALQLMQEAASQPRRPISTSDDSNAGGSVDFDEVVTGLKSTPLTIVLGILMLILAGSFAMRGCGDDRVPTYPVAGRVFFEDGSPVRVGVVELESIEHKTTSTGTIREDGTFVLGTYTENDGAPEGTHRAIVLQMVITDGTINHTKDHGKPVDPRYANYDSSNLKIIIKPIENNQVELRLSDTGKKSHTH